MTKIAFAIGTGILRPAPKLFCLNKSRSGFTDLSPLIRSRSYFVVPFLFAVFATLTSHAQDTAKAPNLVTQIENIKGHLLRATERKYARLNRKLSRNNDKSLDKMQLTEEKLAGKLATTDSIGGARLLADTKKKYENLRSRLHKNVPGQVSEYIPGLDSVGTLFAFLGKPGTVPGISSAKLDQVKAVSAQVKSLQAGLQDAASIKSYLKERKQYLTDQFTKLGMSNSLMHVNKQVYYYQAQVNEYKTMLNDPDRLQRKALALVQGSSVFKDFMARNSQLAQLFSLPGSGGSAGPSLAGLQTLSSVQQQMGSMSGSAGVDPTAMMQQQAQAAQAELNKLKDKINKLGGSGSSDPMPEFKPNNQKTKSFWKRIELGLNIQSQKVNAFLPTTSDIALMAGYKLNDKSTIGIGAGYKIGWGKDISHIRISSQGVSLRTFLDVKLKGNWWISGGYEGNYQQEFTKIDQLKDVNAWQRSGLIGMTKKYKIGKKTGNLQLLWDFLSYDQVPRTQPLKFRLGYSL